MVLEVPGSEGSSEEHGEELTGMYGRGCESLDGARNGDRFGEGASIDHAPEGKADYDAAPSGAAHGTRWVY
jgi:hypothetical protein